ncbi:MAG: pyridoxamine 5'-phosphate oxidase family protein [Candidatus Bathyarchaeota archaeon]|jgi:nitroimidazol reductase NimA-like FMN-containing flavoprotein (pyridoxamine 5'-phosphate oxidase superfamily)
MTGLRRKDKEIRDREEIEEILREALVGRLGTCVDSQPYVVPLSYVYHENRIIFHGAKVGKKLDDIARNPRVCFEVDINEILPTDGPCDYSFRYRSVITNGTACLIKDPEEKIRALKILVEKYAQGKGSRIPTDLTSVDNLAVVEIALEDMVGKRSPA